jgi:hypothetical protein
MKAPHRLILSGALVAARCRGRLSRRQRLSSLLLVLVVSVAAWLLIWLLVAWRVLSWLLVAVVSSILMWLMWLAFT